MLYLTKDFKGSVSSSSTTSQRESWVATGSCQDLQREPKNPSRVVSIWDVAGTAGLLPPKERKERGLPTQRHQYVKFLKNETASVLERHAPRSTRPSTHVSVFMYVRVYFLSCNEHTITTIPVGDESIF